MKPECWDVLADGMTRIEAESAAYFVDGSYVLNQGNDLYAVALHRG